MRIYNTFTKKKEKFIPINPPHVKIYVCGMTVYDYCHLGHARVMVVFDMVVRYLRAVGYSVIYTRNITDIDDKIIKRAEENGETITQVTERYIRYMEEDAAALDLLAPDHAPKATNHIEHIIDLIAKLFDKGLAYQGESGDVFFRVACFPNYGALSGKALDGLRAGNRVEIQQDKEDALDFVLWKKAKKAEPSWDSPWGRGRPGWHIECSAMSMHILGNFFDIHGGGRDLQFPHHENEIAQSVGATGASFVKYWMHNGFVRINDEKMSKSLGNFFILRDVLKKYHGEDIRFFLLQSHYRSDLEYSDANLKEARAGLTGLYKALLVSGEDGPLKEKEPLAAYVEQFTTAMNDDFHTPKAIAILHQLAYAINQASDPGEIYRYQCTLRHLGTMLGLLIQDPMHYLQDSTHANLSADVIATKIAQRKKAREDKNYVLADEIRQTLEEHGIILEDSNQSTIWRRK